MTAFARAIRATALAVGLTLVAIVRFPGGSKFDSDAQGYAWTQNFLSDLGMTVASNGRSNTMGAFCFVAALGALIVGLGGVMLEFLRRYSATATSRRWTGIAGAFGVAACIAFVGVAFTPEDRAMQLHVMFTRVAFRLLPFAAFFLALAAHTSGMASRVAVASWGALSAALFVYAALLTWGPALDSPTNLMTYVLAQKAIVIVLVAVVLFQCMTAERRATP